MSSGERQLLAISILWSLSILANKDMPILIDTPLARLDSKHRQNLLKEYFPKSSHQVLIFSTDEEIDNKYYPLIESSVSHKYLIEFDKKTSLSSIAKGYFKEVINT
jgi:DNA sulfur modification protein DndD